MFKKGSKLFKMCLYPKIIENRHYMPNKQNGGFVPTPSDERLRAVSIGCGKCLECRKQKANSWKARLTYEIRDDPTALFMTMTFSEESLEAFQSSDPNEVAGKAIELFRKRWYKKYGKGIKHWLVTELGHSNTERLHLHGFIWTKKTCAEIEDIWQYGWVDTGEYVNERSVGYCVKYVSKVDPVHKEFISKVFASKGIGKGFIKKREAEHNKFNNENTKEYIRTTTGHKVALPMYYRQKIYTHEEREKLRIQKLNKNIRYVNGHRIDMNQPNSWKTLKEALEQAQRYSEELGYTKEPWTKKNYKKSKEKFGI